MEFKNPDYQGHRPPSLSSNSSIDPESPANDKDVSEVPQQYVDDRDPQQQELMLQRLNSATDHDLERVITNPDAMRRLESISRVLSQRRMSVPGAPKDDFVIDPNDFDLNLLLNTIRNRSDDQGVPIKYSGITLEDVSTLGVDVSTSFVPSVSEVLRGIATLPSAIKAATHPKIRPLIRNVNGLIREGEMLLVLGRPGSGCTTLLKTIAGETDEFKGIEGDILYSGATQDDMQKYFRSEVIYNAECKFFFFCFSFVLYFSISF